MFDDMALDRLLVAFACFQQAEGDQTPQVLHIQKRQYSQTYSHTCVYIGTTNWQMYVHTNAQRCVG